MAYLDYKTDGEQIHIFLMNLTETDLKTIAGSLYQSKLILTDSLKSVNLTEPSNNALRKSLQNVEALLKLTSSYNEEVANRYRNIAKQQLTKTA